MKSAANFQELSKKVIQETLQGKGSEFFAFGNTKFFLKNEIITILEKARSMAMEKKNQAANMIKSALKITF